MTSHSGGRPGAHRWSRHTGQGHASGRASEVEDERIQLSALDFVRWTARRLQQSRTFVGTFGAKFWIGLIGLQTAYWAVVFGPLWRLLRGYRIQFRDHRIRALAFAALFVALLAIFYAARIPTYNPLAYHAVKIQVITIVGGFLIVLPALVGISLIQLAGQRNFRELDPNAADIERYIALLEDLKRLLAIIGGVVALVTLATGALRKAVIANGLPKGRFPLEIVLLWGGVATALALVAYVPAHLTLLFAGRLYATRSFPASRRVTRAT